MGLILIPSFVAVTTTRITEDRRVEEKRGGGFLSISRKYFLAAVG